MPCAAKAGKFNRASLFWLFAALAAFVFAASLAFGGSPEDKSPASKLPLPEAAAFAPQLEGSQEAAKVESENPKGKTRKIDVAKLQGLIDSGRLSDKEASFWIPAEAK